MYKVIKQSILKKKIKLGLLGDSNVGKTSIIFSFLNFKFREKMTTLILDKLETKFISNDGEEKKLILMDNGGAEKFHSIAIKNIKNVDGIILVFDITSRTSFENLSFWINSIKKLSKNPFIVLFGNKIDREKSEWKVAKEELNKFSEENNIKYLGVSAKTKKGIDEGFNYIANKVLENNENECIIIKARKKRYIK